MRHRTQGPGIAALLVLLSTLAAVVAVGGCASHSGMGPSAPTGPSAVSEGPTDDCVTRRMATAYHEGTCIEECKGKNRSASERECAEACRKLEDRTKFLMSRRCLGDGDGDGILDSFDGCPDTPPASSVNWRGCGDEDDDGIPDDEDQCPGSPDDQQTNLVGCESNLGGYDDGGLLGLPECQSEKECERLAEIALPLKIPLEFRQDLARKALARRAHTVACPGDDGPPEQPTLRSPAERINPQEVGPISVTLVNGESTSGDVIPISLEWSEVEDSCEPVTYSVFVEYYHCHQVGSLTDPTAYRNEGWCRWMPYLYESLPATAFEFDLPIGELLWSIHVPFLAELGWSLWTQVKEIRYAPFWLSVRVIAHDGNGTPSPFGNHADTRYLVLYADYETPLEMLSDIPVAP